MPGRFLSFIDLDLLEPLNFDFVFFGKKQGFSLLFFSRQRLSVSHYLRIEFLQLKVSVKIALDENSANYKLSIKSPVSYSSF